jgi:chromosome segregation ATPase
MSTPTARKPTANPANTPPRRPPNENSPNRPPVASAVPASTGQGLARTPSLRQTRLARKPTNRMSNSFAPPETEPDDEETKSANAQLIADLKEQVHRAETASEQYRKQLEVMQKRLDDAAGEQTTSEERDYQRQTEIDRLRVEYKDSIRQYRELELAYDADKNTFLNERERQVNKEADLEAKISRLTATLRARDADRVSASRSGKQINNGTLEIPIDRF